jgi:hypothetical protein
LRPGEWGPERLKAGPIPPPERRFASPRAELPAGGAERFDAPGTGGGG